MAKRNPSSNLDPRINAAINAILDSKWLKEDHHARELFINKVREYSSKPGADFSNVWPKFAIHILATSKYSAIASVSKVDYPRKKEAVATILRVAKLYKSGGTESEFEAARAAADAAADAAEWAAARVWAARAAAVAWAARAAAEAAAARVWAARAADAAEWAAAAGVEWAARAAAEAAAAADAAESAARAWAAAVDAAYKDYANYLLKLLHEASSKTKNPKRAKGKLTEIPSSVKIKKLPPGKAEGSELPLEYAGGLGDEKNKLHRSESALAKGIGAWSMGVNLNKNPKNASAQISKCQKLWGSYCKNPTKKNLEMVKKNLEVMKNSKSKKVRAERARCLRAANRE